MIVFQIVQDGRAGAVVHKFGALVEKGGVVFVGLDHKQGLFWIEAGRHTQAGGHATDQEVGGQLGLLQYPAQHGAGGGLAVRAGHGQNVLLVQNVLAQPLRAGCIRQTLIQNGFHQRITARHHVAHYIEIRG